jgi:uncharacterized paraquat-inducible protein A
MNRKLTTALASAAFLAFVSVPAALTGAQSAQEQKTPAQDEQAQQQQAVPRSGQKTKKDVQSSCPVHPEIKARTAEKCPKCRIEARKERDARAKDKDKVRQRPQQQQEETGSNE